MEAREHSKPILLCQKCFALIPEGAEFCAECGAPAMDDLAEGSESAVYPELARANLLRMRGEYKQAEEICLLILRRHPNSATANTLLGDICADRGDLPQAAEWYEMALDITPDSESDRHKLESVRRRIRDHEAAQTAKTLGLPDSRPKIGLWIGVTTAFIVLVGAVAFLLGERLNKSRPAGTGDIVSPITVPLESSRETSSPSASANDEPATPTPDLLTRIRTAAASEGARIIGASRFPDTMGVLLTYAVSGTEDPRRFAAELGRVTLGQISDAPSVTLLATKDGKVAYVGTMTRERLQSTTTDAWQSEHGSDAQAFADATLGDEWPPPAPAATTPPPANSEEPPG